jgi:hypothetical protein
VPAELCARVRPERVYRGQLPNPIWQWKRRRWRRRRWYCRSRCDSRCPGAALTTIRTVVPVGTVASAGTGYRRHCGYSAGTRYRRHCGYSAGYSVLRGALRRVPVGCQPAPTHRASLARDGCLGTLAPGLGLGFACCAPHVARSNCRGMYCGRLPREIRSMQCLAKSCSKGC